MSRASNTPRSDRNTYFLRPGDVVLFLGNSITAGAEPELEFLTEDVKRQYPELADGPGRVRWILSGLNGNQADNGAERLNALLDLHHPTVCVICYGTCEVTFGNETRFIPSMREILRQLQEARVAITIVSPPPPSAPNWRQANWPASQFVSGLPIMAAQARQLAADANLRFADAYQALGRVSTQTQTELTTDGIHLNRDGYRAMADALQQAWGFGKPLYPPADES